MNLVIPDPSLILLIGPSGAGKSTFAARHFTPTEIVSSDRIRAMITDDENDQRANAAVFALLHDIVRARLGRGKLSVVDATNLQRTARRPLLRIGRQHRTPVAALVFDVPFDECLLRNRSRPSRTVREDVIARQSDEFRANLTDLLREGYDRVHHLSISQLNEIEIQRIRTGSSGNRAEN